jgi:Rrf2 family protein
MLARHPSQARTAERIASATGAPLPTLSKVLQALARSGLIRTTRGPHGGVRLAQDSAQITVFEVVCAVDPVAHVRAFQSEALGPCLYRRWELLQRIATLILRRTTIAELAGKAAPGADLGLASVEELLDRAIADDDVHVAASARHEDLPIPGDRCRQRAANRLATTRLRSRRRS